MAWNIGLAFPLLVGLWETPLEPSMRVGMFVSASLYKGLGYELGGFQWWRLWHFYVSQQVLEHVRKPRKEWDKSRWGSMSEILTGSTWDYQGHCCGYYAFDCLSNAWKLGDKTSFWWTFPNTIMSPFQPSERCTDTSCWWEKEQRI